MEQQNLSWLQEENTQLQNQQGSYEKIDGLVLTDGTFTTITVDASKPFKEYVKDEKTTKKIIPVLQHTAKEGDLKKLWWLNVKNPIYKELIQKLSAGQTKFTIATTGKQEKTQYSFVEQA